MQRSHRTCGRLRNDDLEPERFEFGANGRVATAEVRRRKRTQFRMLVPMRRTSNGLGVIHAAALNPRWTAQNRPLIDTSKPATTGVAAETNGVLLRGLLGAQVGLDLGAPAPRSAFEDVRVMEQPIEERGDGGGVAEQLPPVVHRSV